MSKVVITIEDTPKGTVKFRFDFDPPLDQKDKFAILTEAQATAFDIVDALRELALNMKLTGDDEDGKEISETFDLADEEEE